ncbi:MAG: tripartite tricarboxylate transporter substrate binding protein [Proteobacteria bacterium]|nr:tripartite tricarboxylate transporter substrate binding protein [Burkholderiales bacterium]
MRTFVPTLDPRRRASVGLLATIFVAVAAAVAFAVPSTASAQAWPTRAVRLVVPFAPGGANDIIARILSGSLAEQLGQQFIVDNRAGASGNIGTEIVARAQPDGHTVLIGNVSTNAINPTAFAGTLSFDPVKELVGVTLISRIPNLLVAAATFPPKDFKELLAYARARPGQLNYSNPIGAYSHLDMLEFLTRAGIQMVNVPTKGAGATVAAVLNGEIHFYFTNAATVTPQVLGGRMKAYATSGAQRLADLPDVPTTTELGFPEVRGEIWVGSFVPAKTPVAIIERLNAVTVEATRRPEVRAQFEKARVPVTLSRSPEEFQAYVREETARWARIIKNNDVKFQ